MRLLSFCTESNAQLLLFEAFTVGKFSSVEAKSKSTFPSEYDTIFETYQSFEPTSSTPGGDRHVCLVTFLYEI